MTSNSVNSSIKSKGNPERVLVAMSGGVDSSVAALLLKEAGFDTQGITLKLFEKEPSEHHGEITCGSLKDADDAHQVCAALGIPHCVHNFTHTFGAEVIDRFCDGYINAQTPNPCIDCNHYIKFKTIQQQRRELDFDYIATGHYARRAFDENTGRYLIKCGIDKNKDQSYVLYHLDQDTLAHTLFPLGELSKPRVRELAELHGFINSQKPESQDICFIPDGDYASFIRNRRGFSFEPGPILDMNGKTIGEHNGLINYTIGQRKGIGVAFAEPLYVFAKDPLQNALIVGTDAETKIEHITVKNVNFVQIASLPEAQHFTVKTHYRQTAREAWVEQTNDDEIVITFDEPQRACAAGQAAVIYDDDCVVCGGTIA